MSLLATHNQQNVYLGLYGQAKHVESKNLSANRVTCIYTSKRLRFWRSKAWESIQLAKSETNHMLYMIHP